MAISINWLTRVISVPQSYLSPLGGVNYQLDVEQFRNDLKDIEDDEAGIVHPKTHNRNAPSSLSGVVYAQTFEIINGYTVSFQNTGTPYVVFPVGANHNIGDVTNFDGGMSLVIGNSAGLIVVSSGSGLSSEEHDKLMAIPEADDNATATLNAAQVTPIHADVRKMNNAPVIGTGIESDKWRGGV